MTLQEKQVQRALADTDPLLFLDKEWSPFGYVFYCVKRRMEDDSKPLTAVEWREGNTPLPLSLSIVDKVRSQEGDLTDAIAQVDANNAARKELLRQERRQAQEEIAEEYHKWDKRGFVKIPKGITPT